MCDDRLSNLAPVGLFDILPFHGHTIIATKMGYNAIEQR